MGELLRLPCEMYFISSVPNLSEIGLTGSRATQQRWDTIKHNKRAGESSAARPFLINASNARLVVQNWREKVLWIFFCLHPNLSENTREHR